MLRAKILRCPHAHARIRAHRRHPSAGAARACIAVITGKDMPDALRHHPVDAATSTRSRSTRCASSATRSPRSPRSTRTPRHEAPSSIDVEYELLPACLDPEDGARAPEATRSTRTPRRATSPSTCSSSSATSTASWPRADVVVEGDYFFEGTTHAPIEPHCALGELDEPTACSRCWSATQVPHYLHRELARVLQVPPDRIRVIQPPRGRRVRRQERAVRPRVLRRQARDDHRPAGEDPLHARGGVLRAPRPPPDAHALPRRRRRGTASSPRSTRKILIDGGAYSSLRPGHHLLLRPAPAPRPTVCPAYRFDSTRVFTNKPPCGPKRGHGCVQPRFAFEVQLDKLAERARHRSDRAAPPELRRRRHAHRQRACASPRTASSSASTRSSARAAGRSAAASCRSGAGSASPAQHVHLAAPTTPSTRTTMPQSAVQLKVDRCGRVTRLLAARPTSARARDSMLAVHRRRGAGRRARRVRVVCRRHRSHARSTSAPTQSRVTFMVGNACLDAAPQAPRASCRQAVAEQLGVRAAARSRWHARLRDASARTPTSSVPVAEAFQLAEADFGTLGAVGSLQHAQGSAATTAAAPSAPRRRTPSPRTWPRSRSTPRPACVDVKTIWVAHDCGRALNPVHRRGPDGGLAPTWASPRR